MSNKIQQTSRVISPELENLKKEISSMQSKGMDISSNLLEKTKVRDIGDIESVISDALSLLSQMSPKKDGKATGIIKSLLKSIPGSKKFSNKMEKVVIENKSMKESVDDMHNAIDNALEVMTKDLEDLTQIYDHIDSSLVSGKEKEEILTNFLEKAMEEGRRMDAVHARKLLVQLKAINLTNQEAINGLNMQIKSSEAMTSVLGEILPVLKPTLLQQSAIAVAHMNNERVIKTTEVVSKVLNEIILVNKESSHNTIKETLKLSNKKIIEAETIKKLDSLNEKFSGEMRELAVKMKKEDQEYMKTLTECSNKLLAQKNDLLLLEEAAEDKTTH